MYLEKGQRIRISNKFPGGDTDAGPGAALRELLPYRKL